MLTCAQPGDLAPIMLLTVRGEIDASNARYLLSGDDFHRYVRPGRALVVDMTKVEFFGVQGLRYLFALDDRCRAAAVPWALATSHAVRRMLRVGDPDRSLPAAGSLAEAVRLL
jgi:anti-anti-sigma factor